MLYLFLLSTIVLTSTVGDYVESDDPVKCKRLTEECKPHVSQMEKLLAGPGLTSLVLDGKFTMECSIERLQAITKCRDATRDACLSDQDRDLEIHTAVYINVCKNKEKLMSEADCLTSGASAAAMIDCHIAGRDYEQKCRKEPVCVRDNVQKAEKCTNQTANVLSEMLMAKFNTFMERCEYLMD